MRVIEISLAIGRRKFLTQYMSPAKSNVYAFRSAMHKSLFLSDVLLDCLDGGQVKIISRRYDVQDSPTPPKFVAWQGSIEDFLGGISKLKTNLAYHSIREFVEAQPASKEYETLRQAIEDFGVRGIEEVMSDALGKSERPRLKRSYKPWEDEKQERIFTDQTSTDLLGDK